MHAASLNPADWKQAGGELPFSFSLPPPPSSAPVPPGMPPPGVPPFAQLDDTPNSYALAAHIMEKVSGGLLQPQKVTSYK